MAQFSFQAGRLLCGTVRDYLNKCKWEGKNIDFLESSGFFEREFTIKGDLDDVTEILEDLREWKKRGDY